MADEGSSNGHSTTSKGSGASSHSGAPVCLILGGHDGLRVAEEGVQLLQSLHEPIAVVCLAGQYRTGKSFFLNQLARGASSLTEGRGTSGFRVGPTTESCTRGIWLWDPAPCVRTARGERVLFMDTEGIAATDNDESYDAKIFSLGLLLSSLFVFNTMGVIDEGAIDRLFLVSELTKHVCISSADVTTNSKTASDASEDGAIEWQDAVAESKALAPHFPPFIWLLRDFMLDMQADGASLSPNEYLEKSLELREGNSRRNDDRNKIRQSIQILFDQRECLTLVRPVMDELQLRRAAELTPSDLRPEFVSQMDAIRTRILQVASPKRVLGKTMDGHKLAHLAQCYTQTLNSGAVPDIKAAWAYVSEATCQTAMLNAMELYDTKMQPISVEETEEKKEQLLLSQQEFEKLHKDAQEDALTLFKNTSVEGGTRAVCFQKLKTHIQKQKTQLIADLQRQSTVLCEKILKTLQTEMLTTPLSQGKWDKLFFVPPPLSQDQDISDATLAVSWLKETMDELETNYETQAQGPAKKITFFTFLRDDFTQFYEKLFYRLSLRHATTRQKWETQCEAVQNDKQAMETQLTHQLHDKDAQINRLEDAKKYAEERDLLLQKRLEELNIEKDHQQNLVHVLESKNQQIVAKLDHIQLEKKALELALEKTNLRVDHTQSSFVKSEQELEKTKIQWVKEVDTLRGTHDAVKEEWIQKLADQTAERAALQKTLKLKDHELHQKSSALEMAERETLQLQSELASERQSQFELETECTRLRQRAMEMETQLEETVATQLRLQDHAERDKATLQNRLSRFETQLGRVETDRQVEDVVRDCVSEVVRLAEVDKANVIQEERNVLQERLGELFLKISTLPEFYQREIFCSPDPEPSFFDALTQ